MRILYTLHIIRKNLSVFTSQHISGKLNTSKVTELIQSLPFWAEHRWEVVPLETWSHHLDYLTKLKEQLGL